MCIHSVYDFSVSCRDLFPNASHLFPNKPNGSVPSPSANSYLLGKASEFPGGYHRCSPRDPRLPSHTHTWGLQLLVVVKWAMEVPAGGEVA